MFPSSSKTISRDIIHPSMLCVSRDELTQGVLAGVTPEEVSAECVSSKRDESIGEKGTSQKMKVTNSCCYSNS